MLVITNISALYGVTPHHKLSGQDMAQNPVINNAYIVIEGGNIASFGEMSAIGKIPPDAPIIDAQGKVVLPSFCDSHTHIIYPTTRETEFIDRVKGLTYEEIAKRGGGILNSADVLANTSEDELYKSAYQRIIGVMKTGTGALEIKSGYGLSVDMEMKMLRVARRLQQDLPVTIRTTLLGAHAVGREYAGRQGDYVNMICEQMIPAVAAEGLADFVDVFCDKGFFTTQETEKILEAAAKYALPGKIHANELAVSGGVQVGVKNGALSVDHLEQMDQEAINALKNTTTMPTALPGASFFLGIPFSPVRKMINEGLPVAIASDYNPGSSPCGNMQFMMALGVIRAKLLPVEALTAATLNSAYAMGLGATHGSIAVGKRANLSILKSGATLDLIPYSYGENHIEKIILGGVVIN